MGVRKHYRTTDPGDEVEFREAVMRAILPLIKLLEDEDVRLETVRLIGNLANHGEWK